MTVYPLSHHRPRLEPQQLQARDWPHVIQTTSCPVCVSEKGEPCCPMSNGRPHQARIDLAEAQR